MDRFIHDIVTASFGKNDICMSEPVADAMKKLRAFMFENVYRTPAAINEENRVRAMIAQLFKYFEKAPEELPNEYRETAYTEGIVTAVCDYIACMTDRYAINTYTKIFIPSAWDKL